MNRLQSSERTSAAMATPHSAPDGGTTSTPMTTGIASRPTDSTSQTLLPLPALVTAVAQSTTSSVERALDQHFTSLLRQQQQLVSAVQQRPSDSGSVKGQSCYASTIRQVTAREEPDADFVTGADIDAPPPGPTPERAGHPIPVKGKGGTTEHEYLKPCTSQRDSYHRSNTQGKSVVVEQQPTLSLSNIYNQTTSSMTYSEKKPRSIPSVPVPMPAPQRSKSYKRRPRVPLWLGQKGCHSIRPVPER